MRKEYGVAGLNIFLSLIVMIFIIGLLVMIFVLMGGELGEATSEASSGNLANETILFSDGGTDTSVAGYTDIALSSVVVVNASGGETVPSTNYSVSGGTVTAESSSAYNGTNVKITADYTYTIDSEASDVISDTNTALAGIPTWFALFITIGAMVVLILLTIIIITSIRNSGLITP